jgi:hypothetical protein
MRPELKPYPMGRREKGTEGGREGGRSYH